MFKTEPLQAIYKERKLFPWLPTGFLSNRFVTFLFKWKNDTATSEKDSASLITAGVYLKESSVFLASAYEQGKCTKLFTENISHMRKQLSTRPHLEGGDEVTGLLTECHIPIMATKFGVM